MDCTTCRSRQFSGITIVEMIGLLAVIAILASLSVPRVFQSLEEQEGLVRSTNGVVVSTTVVFTNDRSVYSGIYGVVWVTNYVSVTNPATGKYATVTNIVPIVSQFTVRQDLGGTNISLIRVE